MSTTAKGELDDLSPPRLGAIEIDRIFREESGQAVASPIRFCGDIDVAEAASAYEHAAKLTPTGAEREFFRLGGRGSR